MSVCTFFAADHPLPPVSPDYAPAPADTADIELPTELMLLRERIAENVHDIWAASRMEDGWIYGRQQDGMLKTSPNLVPYGLLPESEKEYDRRTAMETLKLIIKLGYGIEAKKSPEKVNGPQPMSEYIISA